MMKLSRNRVLAAVVILALIVASMVVTSLRPKSVDSILTRLENGVYSGVLLIAEGDEIVHQSGYGFASCDDSVPNSAETVHAIGSITKLFTTVAIAQLDEQGKLNIDDPISNYLDVPADKTDITINHLLNHTAGLETYHETGNLGDFESMSSNKAFDEIMRRPLESTPGRSENYSNSGFTLLALLIESVSGQSYTSYIRENLLKPASMSSTGFWGESFMPIASTPNVVGCGSPDAWEYSWVLVGNGGMVSTVEDQFRWMRALKNGNVLSPATMQHIGLDGAFSGEFGTAGGSSQHEFNAAIEYSGGADITVIAISNRNTIPAEDFAIDLLRAVINEN